MGTQRKRIPPSHSILYTAEYSLNEVISHGL